MCAGVGSGRRTTGEDGVEVGGEVGKVFCCWGAAVFGEKREKDEGGARAAGESGEAIREAAELDAGVVADGALAGVRAGGGRESGRARMAEPGVGRGLCYWVSKHKLETEGTTNLRAEAEGEAEFMRSTETGWEGTGCCIGTWVEIVGR